MPGSAVSVVALLLLLLALSVGCRGQSNQSKKPKVKDTWFKKCTPANYRQRCKCKPQLRLIP